MKWQKTTTKNQWLDRPMLEKVPENIINLQCGEQLNIISLMKWLAEGK